MAHTEEERRVWRMGLTREDIFMNHRRHTRKCKLCGNRHPLTAEYFWPIDKPDVRGLIYRGLLFVCKSCQAHWGDNLKRDVNALKAEIEARPDMPTHFFKPLAERGGR